MPIPSDCFILSNLDLKNDESKRPLTSIPKAYKKDTTKENSIKASSTEKLCKYGYFVSKETIRKWLCCKSNL